MIYLDNNATTRVAPEVLDAMQPYLSEFFGNPSSAHTLGREMKRAVEHSREQVANLIGAADPSEIVFTSCGSESDNWAIRGILARSQRRNTSSPRWSSMKRFGIFAGYSRTKATKLRGLE